MGGQNKLLLPYGGSTVVGSTVDALRRSGLEVTVVTGRDADDVERAVSPSRCVHNPEFAAGLGTSIACGVRHAPEGAVLIALGDMPGLRPEVVRRLVESLHDDDAIVAPVYESDPDRHGHPVLFGASYRDALCSLVGDRGAGSIIAAHKERLVLVPCKGGLDDLDSPTDL